MKPRKQEVTDLIHQNVYFYYSRKIFIYFGEFISYILSFGFILFAVFVSDFLSKFEVAFIIADYAEKRSFTYDQQKISENFNALRLALNLIFIFIAIVMFLYARRLRKNRIFRSQVKNAEQKLNAIIDEYDEVVNELN